MATETPDFVQVQLSATGVAYAGAGAKVVVANGHYAYAFTPGQSVKVLTSEWRSSLSLKMSDGQPIFEVASGAAKTSSGRTISPDASHTDAPEQSTKATQTAAAASAADPEVK
jgi:hypothetical protein